MEYLNTFTDLVAGGVTPAARLEKIWSAYYKEEPEETVFAPLIQKSIPKNVITFISLNPSLPAKIKSTATKGFKPFEADAYEIDPARKKSAHKHFHKFYDLEMEEPFKSNWTAIDLLYKRESKQRELENLFNKKDPQINDFFKDQIKLTFDILEAIQPPIVIMANAFSYKLIHSFSEQLGLKTGQPTDENSGVYRIEGIPFIVRESKYLGSGQWINKDKKVIETEEIKSRKTKLEEEIKRVIDAVNKGRLTRNS